MSDDNKGKAWVNMELMTFWLLIQLATIFTIIFFVLLSFLSHLWFYKCLFPIHNFFHGYRKWMSQNGWRTDRSIIYSCSENHLSYIYPNPIKYCLSGRIIKVLDWFWCKKNFEFWKGKKKLQILQVLLNREIGKIGWMEFCVKK